MSQCSFVTSTTVMCRMDQSLLLRLKSLAMLCRCLHPLCRLSKLQAAGAKNVCQEVRAHQQGLAGKVDR